jgi:hypothetical protein
MNNAQLVEDATALGLTVLSPEANNNRLGISSTDRADLGNALKAYAAQGLDVVRTSYRDGSPVAYDAALEVDHVTQCWTITRGALIGDDVVALVVHDTRSGFTYGRTCLV